MKVQKPKSGKPAKKLKDSKDDSWEHEEKKEGYITPSADDTTGYDASDDDNASDDYSNGRWNKEDAPKKLKKKLKESLLSLVEKQAAKRVNPGEGDKAGSSDSNEYVSGGRTGKTTIQGRLTGIGTKKASPSAVVRVKNYTAGPKGKLPEQADAYRDLAYRIDELLPALVAGAARVGAVVGRGVAAVGKGIVKAGTGAAKAGVRMVKKKAVGMAQDKAAEAGAEGVATGSDMAKKKIELAQQAASDKDLEEHTMKNAYVRRLMEMEGPTTKELDDIKKKPAKIPRKSYFGGATKPGDVDTEAAIEAHKTDVLRAGKAAKEPKAENQSTAYRRIGRLYLEMCQNCKDDGTAAAKEAPEGQKQVAYNKARRGAENKRHGKPGESPRDTQVRRHGGGGIPKETPDAAKADALRDPHRRMAPGDK